MNDFRFGVILFTIGLSVTSCVGKKFEKGAWTTRNDALFPPVKRAEMLDEVLSSHKLVGMKYAGIIDLLGPPDGTTDSSVFYEIEIDYGSDIDPVYTKDLYLLMTKDSIVSSYEIKVSKMR